MRAGFVINFVNGFVNTPTSKEGDTLGANLWCTYPAPLTRSVKTKPEKEE